MARVVKPRKKVQEPLGLLGRRRSMWGVPCGDFPGHVNRAIGALAVARPSACVWRFGATIPWGKTWGIEGASPAFVVHVSLSAVRWVLTGLSETTDVQGQLGGEARERNGAHDLCCAFGGAHQQGQAEAALATEPGETLSASGRVQLTQRPEARREGRNPELAPLLKPCLRSTRMA